ncbi:MAG: helix-hairpin-helix domain-containing protein [Anaerolineae bacterium]|nr:helix-hairpin-helix domain-containing protein [Anaerolineae bacterium]
MKNKWEFFLFGILGGLLGSGLVLIISSPPRGQPVELLPPPSPPPLTVHVEGAVAQPGVYALPPGSRLRDAVEAAGGLLPDADPARLNLAAFLSDGQRITVPLIGQEPAEPLTAANPDGQPGALVNINTAALAELEDLPGIGPVKAQAIIDHRTIYGPFESIEEIMQVPGIGPATFDLIQDLITVEDFP